MAYTPAPSLGLIWFAVGVRAVLQEPRGLTTPDGRYLVVRGRLWRTTNPRLSEDQQSTLVSELMSARRAVRDAKGDPTKLASARSRVDAAKQGLGERGPVWWEDGAPDYGRRLAVGTPYADWFASLPEE